MKKILSAALLLASLSINAQETYTNAELATQDLNGDARYVGMGGAMEALGANISAASENPASMGLFRSNAASVSFGMSNHEAIGNADADSRTVVNLDQAGIVFNHRIGFNSYINWGINYHRSTNFNQIMAVASEGLKYGDITVTNEDGSFAYSYPVYGSQNGITYEKGGDIVDSQVDKLNYALLGDQTFSSYDNLLKRDRKGYIANYDFTISGNHHDRIFWGATITIADVKYKNRTKYEEKVLDLGEPNGNITLDDTHNIKGFGTNIKAGIIVRPMETNPFRIGLSVESPMWYFLDSDSKTYGAHTIYIYEDNYMLFPTKLNTRCEYSFAITTPWKFGLTAGTTFGRNLAVGASFNFADYSTIKSKIKQENKYNWWKEGNGSSYLNDKAMNTHTEATLKGVSTLKLGAEYRLTPNFSLRAGYNLETPIYSKDGVRNMFINSPGIETATTTDYTNWQSTNRFTCGAGYSIGKFFADVAFLYSSVSGTYLPYQNCSDKILDCYVTPSRPIDLTSKRTQLICTIGVKF